MQALSVSVVMLWRLFTFDWCLKKKKHGPLHNCMTSHMFHTFQYTTTHTSHSRSRFCSWEGGMGEGEGGWRLPPDTPRVTELNKDWLFNNTEQSIPLRLTDSSLRLFHLWTTVPTSSRVPSSAPFHRLSWVEQGGSKSLKYCLHIKGIKTIR